MIIEKKMLNSKIDDNVKIERFDMAVNFYAIINVDGNPNLISYDFNPAWNSWYPFYDDVNKTPIIKKSKAKTYGELIKECDESIKISIDEKINLAKARFKKLIGDSDFEIEKLENFIVYEIKYSKTANLYTIYKLYNFVITNIDDKDILFRPKKLKYKLFNLNNFIKENLVSNAVYIVEHEDLKKFCL